MDPQLKISAFSYAEDSKIYVEGTPGVSTSGFVNVDEIDINHSNVIERAKNECTIPWDMATIRFDNDAEAWRVSFSTQGTLGGCQDVYLSENGLTLLVVYGE